MKPTIKQAREIAKANFGRLPLSNEKLEVGRNQREVFYLIFVDGKYVVQSLPNFAQWRNV